MSKLSLYSRAPEWQIPDGWNASLNNYTTAKYNSLTLPHDRASCIWAIPPVIASVRADNPLPWMPYEFTEPIQVKSPSNTEHHLEYIDNVTISYSGVNSVGTLKAKLHPDTHYPTEGDYITAFWSDDEANDGKTGLLVFYGRVRECEHNDDSIDILAQDAMITLAAGDQVSVSGFSAEKGIYHLALRAGAYMYKKTSYTDPNPPMVNDKVYSSYQNGIVDILQKWYTTSKTRQFLRAEGGVLTLCSYEFPDNLNIIDKSMISNWRFKIAPDKTYTQVAITYPVLELQNTAGGGQTIATLTNYHLGTSWNTIFRFPQAFVYHGQASNLNEANDIANYVLQYHGYPAFQLTLEKAKGIPYLLPGDLIGVPFKFPNASAEYIAVCVIRNITHTFGIGSYTMDILADLDPFDWDVMPFEDKPNQAAMERPSAWSDKFQLITTDYSRKLPLRMPRWLRESLGIKEGRRSRGGETEVVPGINKERIIEMQEKVFLISNLSVGELQKIKYGTQGYIGIYNGIQVVIPTVTWSSNLDREARMHENIFAYGVLIDRESQYNCYLLATPKGRKISKPVAGVVKTLTENTMTIVTAADELTVTRGEGLVWGVGTEVVYLENGYNQHMVIPFAQS